VLRELSWSLRAEVLVLNKTDRVEDPLALELLARASTGTVVRVSAATGKGLADLARVVSTFLDARSPLVEALVPIEDGKSAAQCKAAGAVLAEEVIGDSSLKLRLRLTEGALGNLMRAVGERVRFTVLDRPPALAPLAPPETP
jgi:GTP-binding protein HflX